MADTEHVTILDAVGGIFSTISERLGALLATGAILLPVWHPTLKETSETAALIAPILGCVWMLVQIFAKVKELTHKATSAGRRDPSNAPLKARKSRSSSRQQDRPE